MGSISDRLDSIGEIRDRVRSGQYRFTVHGIERCIEQRISPNDVEDGILSGEVVEDYPENLK
jgi:hypothetical protein